jgi:hypothetical protein
LGIGANAAGAGILAIDQGDAHNKEKISAQGSAVTNQTNHERHR